MKIYLSHESKIKQLNSESDFRELTNKYPYISNPFALQGQTRARFRKILKAKYTIYI